VGADNISQSPNSRKSVLVSDGKEDFSTEQRPAQEEARLPLQDEHRQGPARSQAPARKGPEEIDGLTGSRARRFTRADRLLRRSDFEAVYSRGARIPGRYFNVFILPNAQGHSRLGLTLSRKVGIAAVRNKARRRLREAFRLDDEVRTRGLDIVVHAHPRIAEAGFAQIRAALSDGVKRFSEQRSGRGRGGGERK